MALATAGIALVLGSVALRIAYPYELEWMEGGVLEHVRRAGAAEPIYVEPSADFVPFIYPPLYYYLAAAVTSLTGAGFFGPRLLSLAASIGAMGLIFLFVYRETRHVLGALSAAALYALSFALADGWFDLARTDALMPFLVLAAGFLIRFGRRSGSGVAAGLLLCGALFTKQSAVVFAAPLLLVCLANHPRRFAVLASAFVVPGALIWIWLDGRTDGWFSYYVFVLPRQHSLEPEHLVGFWTRDLLPALPVAVVMIATWVVLTYRGWRQSAAGTFYAALLVGGLAVSWLSRLHTGGGRNVLLPALAAVAVLFGLAIPRLLQIVDGSGRAGSRRRSLLRTAVLLGAGGQLLWLGFNPVPWIPTRADRRAGDALVEQIRAIPGDVLIPSAPYLAVRAGKPTCAHLMAVLDVLRGDEASPVRSRLVADLQRQLRDPRYRAILLCRDEGWLNRGIRVGDDFAYQGPVVDSPEAFRPKSGSRGFVPIHLFVRR